MKKTPHSSTGKKILIHDRDLELARPSDVEQRAEEIAAIEGHALTRDDRVQAEHELGGDDIPPTTEEDAESLGGISRDPSEPPSIPGRQIPDQEEETGQSTIERLVTDGVNEAEHDQMLAARRRKKQD